MFSFKVGIINSVVYLYSTKFCIHNIKMGFIDVHEASQTLFKLSNAKLNSTLNGAT